MPSRQQPRWDGRKKPPRKLSQSPAAIRMRRSRYRRWSGAIALPPHDILPDTVERLARLGWLDPKKAEAGDPKAISAALLSLAEEALRAGAKPPKDRQKLIAFRIGPEGIRALVDSRWLFAAQEAQRPKDIAGALCDAANAAMAFPLYGKKGRPR
jgi:hypothetical protein